MAHAIGDGLREAKRTYFGNATAVRDFRSQIRGTRALVLLTLYLLLLLMIVAAIYVSTVQVATVSISVAQESLSRFYVAVLALLAAAVTAITPALSALAVIGEKQRRSLDLVFSAPVTPYYFLVGKLISNFRWTALLILLAMPFCAVSIVLGGATWTDALGAFLILLWAGLLYSAIGIVLSTLAATPVAAIMQTYAVVGVYSMVVGIASTASSISYAMGRVDIPWWTGFSPFAAGMMGSSSAEVFGIAVPHWVSVGLVTLVAVRLLLLGAASAMSGYDAPETRRLRIEGWVVMIALGFFLGGLAAPNTAVSPAGPMADFGSGWGATTALLMVPLLVFLPNLVCSAPDADRRFRFNGMVDWRQVWRGTPAGALPYLVLLWAGLFGGSALRGLIWQDGAIDAEFATRALWALAFLYFWWALGQFVSAYATTLRGARAAIFALGLIVLVIPFPVLSVMTATADPGNTYLFALHLMSPLFWRSDLSAGVHLVALAAFGMGAAALARNRYQELGYGQRHSPSADSV
ncbi:MAG: ABC transporter permease [Chthonomonadaceae bacterium]|nr:ABC transporter permease [Chthonomonadaceae bacterium]